MKLRIPRLRSLDLLGIAATVLMAAILLPRVENLQSAVPNGHSTASANDNNQRKECMYQCNQQQAQCTVGCNVNATCIQQCIYQQDQCYGTCNQ